MSRYLTVVYQIKDEKHQETQDLLTQIFESLKQSSAGETLENEPFRVTAVSNDHELARLEKIEALLDNQENDCYVPAEVRDRVEEILSQPPVT